MLVTSIFFFSHNVFQKVLPQGHKKSRLCGKVLNLFNPFPNKPWFLRVRISSLLKTLREKEKLLVTSNFSFSHSVFNLFGEFSAIFIKLGIVPCKLSFWSSWKLVVWERVKLEFVLFSCFVFERV